MMIAPTTTTTLKTCSKCGTDKTYLQNNCEKWYYIYNDNNDVKERICKNCYSKIRTINRNIPTIDLTKVKPSEIKIDNNNNNLFSSTTTKTEELLIDIKKKYKQQKHYDDMSLEERSAMRKFYRKKYERNLNKKLKYIPVEHCLPFVTDLVFCPSGINSGGRSEGTCRLCGESLYHECGVKLVIPNFEIKNKSLLQQQSSSSSLVLCKICLERLNKFCSASKTSSDQDKLLRLKMFEREKINENKTWPIPKDKTDHRNYIEIRDEIEKETKKQLCIPNDYWV